MDPEVSTVTKIPDHRDNDNDQKMSKNGQDGVNNNDLVDTDEGKNEEEVKVGDGNIIWMVV